MFFLCESVAAATYVFSVRKRSGSNKAPSRKKITTRYNEKKDQLSSGESATGYFYIDIVL